MTTAEYQRAWRQANHEKALEYERRYREKSRDKRRAAGRAYYHADPVRAYTRRRAWAKANSEKVRAYQKQWQRRRRASDATYVLRGRLQANLRQALLGKAGKSASTFELVGCSPVELRVHIEKQFKSGMSWDRPHEFHVDHIRPVASFDLRDPAQQRACFHFTNLQPLWAQENRAKGAR